ncbi:hypothetical protein [Vibrio sp. D431a]|uniref:DUF7281 domain-containing protein n=1 Tax=Vibrio sp. D431a TaxID=2837388 RepID=UPI00255622F5|nr:hypothetical protein [Vibrio sp. D431a]MDK9789999.1 hypothetical protein [Vibrio sp. D431a]
MIDSEKLTNKDLNWLFSLKLSIAKDYTSTRRSGIAKYLNEEFGVGFVKGGYIHLSRDDRIKVRGLLKRSLGFDIYRDPMPKSRIETAKIVSNEKLCTKPVRNKLISLSSQSGVIKVNGEEFKLFSGGYMTLPMTELTSIEHSSVVVVENFEAFIASANVEFDLDDPLILYRGDSMGAVVSSDIRDVLGVDFIYGWFDYDFAGISLAKSMKCDAIFLPEVSDLELLKYGRESLYEKQQKYLKGIEGCIEHEKLEPLVRNKVGLTQEAIIAHEIKMESYSIIGCRQN